MLKKLISFYLKNIKKLDQSSKIINFSLRRYRKRVFLVDVVKDSGLTYRDVARRAEKIILFLKEKGIKKNEVVAFFSSNCSAYFEIRIACCWRELVFFALPFGLTSEEIIRFLNLSGARVFFYKNSEGLDLERIRKETQLRDLIDLDKDYQEIFQHSLSSEKPFNISKGKGAITLNLSSGTSGSPKIIQLTDKNWVASLYSYLRNAEISFYGRVVFLACVPFATSGSTSFLPSLLRGATVIVMEKFLPEETIDVIKRYHVTHLYLTPTQFLQLFDKCTRKAESLPGLKNIILGTEKISPYYLKKAIEFFGPKFSIGYGMAEALPPLALLSPRHYHQKGKLREEILKSAGRVVEGVKIKIVDEAFKELPAGIVGRIIVCSQTVSPGYLINSKDNLKYFNKGWFYTKDYGYLDKENYLYILGRDVEIVSSGRKIYFVRELEEQLLRLPFIYKCALVFHKEKKYLFICPKEGFDRKYLRDKILEFCVKNFTPEVVPQQIVIKEDLPLAFSGKLDRRKLIEEIS